MNTLYETDFNLWLDEQSSYLKNQNFSQLDLENLIEEIESMARSDKRSLRSQMVRILKHMLKLKYQPTKQVDSSSWGTTIRDGQNQIEAILEDSPSLKTMPGEYLEKAYSKALKEASIETGLPLLIFEKGCPWTIEQVLGE